MKKQLLRRVGLPLVLSLVCGVASASAQPAATAPATASGERNCHLPGAVETLRCVNIKVPLDHADKKAGELTLHVTVAHAFRPGTRTDPLFVLAGGPGQAGGDILPLLKMAFDRVRATRDIVFIDQRGTGLSGKLDCASRPEHDQMSPKEIFEELRSCINASKTRFSAYTTAAAATDLELVRKALGYGQVNVWGGSYGTRLAQAYARAYPDSVRSLILDGVASPEQVIPAAGRDAKSALDTLFAQCAADKGCKKAFPNLRAQFDGLMNKVQAGGVRVDTFDPRTAEPTTITLSAERFSQTVHNILYSPADARRLPFLIHNASRGRWQPFIARQNLVGDFGNDAGVAMLLHLAVVCAEDMPRFTDELRQSDTSILTRANSELMPTACRMMNVPAVAGPATTRIKAPSLLLSGALDPVTPPHRAASAARLIDKAQQIVVANAGHGVSHLGCAPRLLREFIDQPEKKLNASCMAEIPAPTFQLGNAGPQP